MLFHSCLSDSRSVKECRVLSYSRHRDSTATRHLSKTIADIIKRLKSDSGVGDACQDTIGALSRIYLNTDADVVMFVEPLFKAMTERNKVVQSGAAMCMARLVESAATPPITSFQKLCPRICKLLSNPCFLAKPSLLLVVSNLSQVGAIVPQSLDSLLESIHDCLASTCWATRKAAADTLTALASHSSTLIKDKTDFTLAVLHNCQVDKMKAVRESVTEALQLWISISGKCEDIASLEESKSSSGEQFGSEKTAEKRSDHADLLRKDTFDGSSLSPGTAAKEKGGLPEKEAVVILTKKTPAFSDRECIPGFFQRLESGIHDLSSPGSSNHLKYIQADDHELLYSKYHNLESASDKQVKGKFDGNGSRVKPSGAGVVNAYQSEGSVIQRRICNDVMAKIKAIEMTSTTGKYIGRAPGDRDLQFDAATKGRMWISDIAPHAASRNGQARPRSPRSEQHENEHMGNGTRGRDNKASETTRFGEGPSTSEDEATLRAVKVAGKDGAVTRPTPVATVHEAKAMGDEENKRKELARLSTLFNNALKSFCAGNINSAYAEIFGLGYKKLVFIMMVKTGPSLDRMSNENANEALKFISLLLLRCEHSQNRAIFDICVSWIQQLVQLLLQGGSDTFGVPRQLRDDIMFNLGNAYLPKDRDLLDSFLVQLSSAWDTEIIDF